MVVKICKNLGFAGKCCSLRGRGPREVKSVQGPSQHRGEVFSGRNAPQQASLLQVPTLLQYGTALAWHETPPKVGKRVTPTIAAGFGKINASPPPASALQRPTSSLPSFSRLCDFQRITFYFVLFCSAFSKLPIVALLPNCKPQSQVSSESLPRRVASLRHGSRY